MQPLRSVCRFANRVFSFNGHIPYGVKKERTDSRPTGCSRRRLSTCKTEAKWRCSPLKSLLSSYDSGILPQLLSSFAPSISRQFETRKRRIRSSGDVLIMMRLLQLTLSSTLSELKEQVSSEHHRLTQQMKDKLLAPLLIRFASGSESGQVDRLID